MSDPKTPVAEDSQPDVGRLPFSRSLRGKLILTLGLSIALTAAVLSIADYRYVRAMLRESTEQQLTLRTDGLREVLLAYVAHQRERVSLVASRTRLRQLIAGWGQGQISQDELVEATSRILRDARESTSGFHNIRIADKTGLVITATEASLIGANVAGIGVFAAALEGPVLGVPEAVNHGFDSILGAPARSADGEVLGVVLVTLDAEPMHRILGQMPSRFRTARVRIGAPEGNNIRYLFQGGETAHRVVSPAADPGMARALAGESGFDAMIDSTGHELLVAYRTVGYGGWGLVAEVDVDEAYAPIFDLSVVILMTALVVGLLGLVGSVRVAGNISRPLLRLARVAERVGGGDHGIRARVHGQDEVAVVARSFNLMTEQVEQHRLHLQEQVAERTRALRERTTQLEAANTELGALVRMLESQAETIDRDLKRA